MPSAPYDLSISAYGVRCCAARVAQDYGEHPETVLTLMRWALTAAASASGGSRQSRPTHPHLATAPCSAPPVPREPPPEGVHASQGPAHGDRPRDRVRARRRCTPPSGYVTGVSAARVHHPGKWTEYRNPTT
jgi:hypothetical protein